MDQRQNILMGITDISENSKARKEEGLEPDIYYFGQIVATTSNCETCQWSQQKFFKEN